MQAISVSTKVLALDQPSVLDKPSCPEGSQEQPAPPAPAAGTNPPELAGMIKSFSMRRARQASRDAPKEDRQNLYPTAESLV